ncbi:MAG: SDR family NAD(P)-dependent oxidoreductase [Caulobacterales bacterium]
MRLEGKVALVTGAAGGIGTAISARFAAEGAHVVLADLDEAKVQDAAAQIPHRSGEPALGVRCDVSREDDVGRAVEAAIARFGAIDAVVNNAGMMTFTPLHELTADQWLKVLGVDLLGAFYFTKQALLRMPKGGAIVNIASVHAVETTPNVAPYAAAKAALLSLTRSTAIEGKARGVRANAILPGAIDTPMLWDNPNVKSGAEVIDRNNVGRPQDVAAAAAFLASEDAAFITGTSLNVDGGRLAQL